MNMKRYFLFYWPNNNQDGGINDLVGTYDSIEDAKATSFWNRAQQYPDEFTVQILDIKNPLGLNEIITV